MQTQSFETDIAIDLIAISMAFIVNETTSWVELHTFYISERLPCTLGDLHRLICTYGTLGRWCMYGLKDHLLIGPPLHRYKLSVRRRFRSFQSSLTTEAQKSKSAVPIRLFLLHTHRHLGNPWHDLWPPASSTWLWSITFQTFGCFSELRTQQ